ncbi:MAG: hypothetical protein E6G58_08310 [Actinobacteria bacterium]|nr:MAG: hypothetical protein E6G58_08310 [Actinomycetota bacterium]
MALTAVSVGVIGDRGVSGEEEIGPDTDRIADRLRSASRRDRRQSLIALHAHGSVPLMQHLDPGPAVAHR